MYKQKEPGMISQVGIMMENTWTFVVTTVVKGWKTCSNGVGTMVKNIWNGMKWLMDFAGKIWKGMVDCVGNVWNGLKRWAEWVFTTMMWVDEYVYFRGLWMTQWYLDSTEWLTELTWNGMEWLAAVSKENASWLTEKTWIGSKRWAEWAWREAKRLANWSWTEFKRNCKPLEPALEYILEIGEVLIKFYSEYVHGESKAFQKKKHSLNTLRNRV